ncbi:hypothetical protein [Acidisphaera sp. S103]|uniref:hypothetical protein n=1 Tax=Acidisphaera sp. S103 TaxID=1747223 RepID=UPI00131E8235|nr:hypothetical protein [Acidisphaera sp. S103]
MADRWHLPRNLSDTVQAVVDRRHVGIRRVSKQIAEEAVVEVADGPVITPDTIKPTAAGRRGQVAYGRRQARYEEAARLKATGMSLKWVAASIGVERMTVRRWLRAGRAPLWRQPHRIGVLGPYRAHLDRRWTEGCHNAAQLWRELVALGFTGRPGIVVLLRRFCLGSEASETERPRIHQAATSNSLATNLA